MVKRAINTGDVFGDLTIIIETSPNNYLCKLLKNIVKKSKTFYNIHVNYKRRITLIVYTKIR